MTTSVSFRLSAAAFVVLLVPVLTSIVSRCAGQEPARGIDRPHVVQAADRKGRARVLAAEVRAALGVLRDPDDAYQLLKTALDTIRNDHDLSEACRERLKSHLEWALWGVAEGGIVVKRLKVEWLDLQADFRACLVRSRFQLERWKVQLGLLFGTE